MRRSFRAGLTAATLASGTLLGVANPAQAADSAVLYVRQLSASCSDTGPGTLEQPFCTIGAAAAAVTAGQTVDVGRGTYAERVVINRSGTPDQPITFRAAPSTFPALAGPTAGFVIDGQHDITIENLRATGANDVPALDLRDASGITVDGGIFVVSRGSTTPAVRLAGVTGSSLKRFRVDGNAISAGVVLDTATRGVTVNALYVTGGGTYATVDHSIGIRVGGSSNTVVNNVVMGYTGAAIAVEPGAAGTVVANNDIGSSAGYGIHNRGATGTAITNNTVKNNCLGGIRVDGASAAVSVQNNALSQNGRLGLGNCDPDALDGVELGVYDAAVEDIVVDYNNAYHNGSPSSTIYAWNGTRMSLAAFRAASGQAAHDKDTPHTRDNTDSANSAAPGYQTTDRAGSARADDPAVANTGAGPVTYADRGATEVVRSPTVQTNVGLDLATRSVRVDASASTPGFVPITSYEFSFGDGTVVTQASPIASHRYATAGEYSVSTKATGSDGRWSTRTDFVSILSWTGTVGLRSLYNRAYVATSAWGTALEPNQAGLVAAAQFDIAQTGGGRVALVHRATGKYVSADADGVNPLTMTTTKAETAEQFVVVRHIDRTISLRSLSSNRYVSISSPESPVLIANRTTIGQWEKFYPVRVSGAVRSVKPLPNRW